MKISKLATAALASVALLGLAGCAQGGAQSPSASGDVAGDITFRLWDEKAADAYEASIAAFEAANPDVHVTLDVVPWDDYFTTLRSDVASGTADDVFWLNGAYYRDYADNGYLVDVNAALGADASADWSQPIMDQYTSGGKLWGVPQITDGGSAVYYNQAMLDAAGVTAADIANATWDPADPSKDTFLPILQRLTLDGQGRNATDAAFDANDVKQYGFNAGQELQNIMLNFIGSNGGTFQDDAGRLTFTNPKTQQAFEYLVKLINEYHVAPPASSTNDNGDFTRDEFIGGRMALFMSGSYNLANVHDGAGFAWGVAEMPSGPAGKVTTSPGVIAAGNANSAHPEATAALLSWLGSTEGATYLGETGAAVPAVGGARAAYDGFWQQQGVDVAPFFAPFDTSAPLDPPTGQNFGAMLSAYTPKLSEVFLGQTPPAEGLRAAEEAGNAAA